MSSLTGKMALQNPFRSQLSLNPWVHSALTLDHQRLRCHLGGQGPNAAHHRPLVLAKLRGWRVPTAKSTEPDSPEGKQLSALPALLLLAVLGTGHRIAKHRGQHHTVPTAEGAPRTGQGGGPTSPGNCAAQSAAQPHPPVCQLTWCPHHSRAEGGGLSSKADAVTPSGLQGARERAPHH